MMEERITELESRLAWQEDTIEALNSTVALQQKQIDQMQKICRNLIERFGELSETVAAASGGDPGPETPPHY